jgi:hypothetical protein
MQSQIKQLQKQVFQVQKDNQKIRPLLLNNKKKTSPANNKNTKRRGTRRTK